MFRKPFAIVALPLIAIAMSACSAGDEPKPSLDPSEGNSLIVFSVGHPSATREMSSSLTEFKVAAFDAGLRYFPCLMSAASYDGGHSWTTSTDTYWPARCSDDWPGLTFVAYADGNGNALSFDSGHLCFSEYEVSSDVSRQSEFFYAVTRDVRTDSFGGRVPLQFRQALARIGVSVKTDSKAYDDIEIIAIELGGVKGRATYELPKSSTDAYTTGRWTFDASTPDIAYRLDPDTGTRANEVDNILYLIPQGADQGAYIKVTARMKPHGGTEYVSEESVPITVDWEEGQRYDYIVSWDGLPIALDMRVADFNEVNITADL